MVSGALPLHPWTAPTCEINRRLTTTASAKPVANGLHPDAHLELFGIETCEACGGKVRVIASLEDPAVIGKILGHLAARDQFLRETMRSLS